MVTFIKTQKPFPLTKLSLHVDHESLEKEEFIAILEQLNGSSISEVNLIFFVREQVECEDTIVDILSNTFATKVSYPLHIKIQSVEGVEPSDLALENFQNTIIANIQKRNKSKNPVIDKVGKMATKPIDQNDPLSKKINLKELN